MNTGVHGPWWIAAQRRLSGLSERFPQVRARAIYQDESTLPLSFVRIGMMLSGRQLDLSTRLTNEEIQQYR